MRFVNLLSEISLMLLVAHTTCIPNSLLRLFREVSKQLAQ